VQHDLQVYHLDLMSAFLHEDYEGPTSLYMAPLTHFDGTPRHTGMISRVVKNIFGTPNAPNIYIKGLQRHLDKHGYCQIKENHNVYVKRHENSYIAIAVTMDDFCCATNDSNMYQYLQNDVGVKYKVKDLAKANHLIGWTIQHDRNTGTMHISQTQLTKYFIALMTTKDAKEANTELSRYTHGSQRNRRRSTGLRQISVPYSIRTAQVSSGLNQARYSLHHRGTGTTQCAFSTPKLACPENSSTVPHRRIELRTLICKRTSTTDGLLGRILCRMQGYASIDLWIDNLLRR